MKKIVIIKQDMTPEEERVFLSFFKLLYKIDQRNKAKAKADQTALEAAASPEDS